MALYVDPGWEVISVRYVSDDRMWKAVVRKSQSNDRIVYFPYEVRVGQIVSVNV